MTVARRSIVWPTIDALLAGALLAMTGCPSSTPTGVQTDDAGIDAALVGPFMDLAVAHDAATNGVIDSSTSGDMVASCSPGGPFGGGEVAFMGTRSVTATIVDQFGAPVVGQPLYICGIDICSAPATTNPQGQASISTNLTMKKAAFKFGDTIAYAELTIPLTTATTNFGTLTLAKLPASGPALTPGTDAKSGDVTVSLAANAVIAIDTITYDTPQKQQFRAAALAVDKATAVLGPVQAGGKSANFALLYGLAPAESVVCPAAKVTIALPHQTMTPNDLGWAAGTAVEFWVTTTDTGQTYAPYAGWTRISDGVVSVDGMTASTVDGQGFNFLESFAVRLKE